jgi:hypothetical protein
MFSLVMRMNPQLRCRFQANVHERINSNHRVPGHLHGPTNPNRAAEQQINHRRAAEAAR